MRILVHAGSTQHTQLEPCSTAPLQLTGRRAPGDGGDGGVDGAWTVKPVGNVGSPAVLDVSQRDGLPWMRARSSSAVPTVGPLYATLSLCDSASAVTPSTRPGGRPLVTDESAPDCHVPATLRAQMYVGAAEDPVKRTACAHETRGARAVEWARRKGGRWRWRWRWRWGWLGRIQTLRP